MPSKIGIQVYKTGGRRHLEALASFAAAVQALLALHGTIPTEPAPPVGHGHYLTQTNADGRIVVPEGVPPGELNDAIQQFFPRDTWGDAARVSFYEAAWSATAERNTLDRAGGRCNVPIGVLPDGTRIISEDSVGYYQINVCAHGHDRAYWQDARNNVSYAASLYRANGWRDWVYTATRLGLL